MEVSISFNWMFIFNTIRIFVNVTSLVAIYFSEMKYIIRSISPVRVSNRETWDMNIGFSSANTFS